MPEKATHAKMRETELRQKLQYGAASSTAAVRSKDAETHLRSAPPDKADPASSFRRAHSPSTLRRHPSTQNTKGRAPA
eukprot:60299-Pyramimonas_sp.AAC.1